MPGPEDFGGGGGFGANDVGDLISGIITIALVAYTGYQIYQAETARSRDSGPLAVDRSKPQTYAARGSYIPYILGHRRVGPVVLWVGDRRSQLLQVTPSPEVGSS